MIGTGILFLAVLLTAFFLSAAESEAAAVIAAFCWLGAWALGLWMLFGGVV